MSGRIVKAWALGMAIVLVAHGAWILSLLAGWVSGTSLLLLWGSPALAAFVSSCLAPRWKMLMGAAIAVPAAALVGVLNFTDEVLGSAVDFPGIRGALTLLMMFMAWNLLLCTATAAAGYLLTRKPVSETTE